MTPVVSVRSGDGSRRRSRAWICSPRQANRSTTGRSCPRTMTQPRVATYVVSSAPAASAGWGAAPASGPAPGVVQAIASSITTTAAPPAGKT